MGGEGGWKAYIVLAKPTLNIPKYINALKITSREIRRKFPEVKRKLWKNVFWSPSYFLATTGQVTLDVLKKYVESLKEMLISYKFRIYPSKIAEAKLNEQLELCRYTMSCLKKSTRQEKRVERLERYSSLMKLKQKPELKNVYSKADGELSAATSKR